MSETHPNISEVFLELKLLLWLSFPIVLNALIGQSQLVSLYFVGRLDEAKYIGGATLGSMMCNLTGYSLMIGMCSALDTLLSQAFGAKSYYLLGLYVQRAMLILTACSVVVALIWSQTDLVLIYLLGIDVEISNIACTWAKILALGLWPSLIFEALKRWLQSQNLLWPTIISTASGTIFNILCNYYFLYILDAGFEGVALTLALSQWFQLVMLSVIITLRKCFIYKFYKRSIKSSSKMSMISRFSENNNNESKFTHSEYQPITKFSAGDEINSEVDHKNSNSHSFNGKLNSFPYNSKQTDSQPFAIEISKDNTTNSSVVLNQASGSDNNSCTLQDESNDLMLDNQDSIFDKENNFPLSEPAILDGWYHFLQLGVPGAVSMFIEWGSFELAAGIASRLGPVPLAVHGIYMNTAALFYMMPFAISQATTILAGQYVGSGEFNKARLVTKLGIALDFLYGLLAGTLLITVLRPVWGPIFTTSKDVQELLYATLPIMFLYLFVDATKCITLNILRSSGRPTITVVGNTVACLLILLPCGYIFSITLGWGLVGLWLAMSLAWIFATFVYFYFVYYSDWERLQVITSNS